MFIELTDNVNNCKWIVNTEQITLIEPDEEGIKIYLSGDELPFTAEESYEQVKKLLNMKSDEKALAVKTEKSNTRFVPPTLEEVFQYCLERQNGINPQHFIDYYEARGWVLSNGKKVRDWRACIRTWERNEAVRHDPTQPHNPFDGVE